jgi:hypothetical protein
LIEGKRFSLIKPTLQTGFHVDFDWWRKSDRSWRVFLRSNLCPEHQQAFGEMLVDEEVDWIDPDTAEVQRVDGLQHVLITHCARQPGFIPEHSTLVDAVFRIFLANGNMPLTPLELSDRVGRPAETILRTLAGARVYKGIRPCSE